MKMGDKRKFSVDKETNLPRKRKKNVYSLQVPDSKMAKSSVEMLKSASTGTNNQDDLSVKRKEKLNFKNLKKDKKSKPMPKRNPNINAGITENKLASSKLEKNDENMVCSPKLKHTKGKTERNVETNVRFPKKPEELSGNWKALLQADIITARVKKSNKRKEKQQTKPLKTEIASAPEIWFDDVDEALIESQSKDSNKAKIPIKKCNGEENPLVKEKSFDGLTKAVSMDCEMVGVGDGGIDSILARASIVNQFGKCIYDKFVKATEKVTDYRTKVSGIRRSDIEHGVEFATVQKEISDILKDRILVGHAVHNDLKVLYLDHPHRMLRDTQRYKPFRHLFNGRNPSLKKLTAKVLGVGVQEGEHNSVQDAQAAMRLYTMHKIQWEKELSAKHKHSFKSKKKKKKVQNIEVQISDSD